MLSTPTLDKSGVPACETTEYFGVATACGLIQTHNSRVQKKLGDPCAIMRRGCLDNLLYRCERVLEYATSRKIMPGPANPPTFYTQVEGARFVGVSQMAFRTILKNQGLCAPAKLVGGESEGLGLWPELWLRAIRRLIADGEIRVRRGCLTKPRLGATTMPPRHCLAEDQSQEAHRLAKAARAANPFADILW